MVEKGIYREAMSCLTTAVNVITSAGEAGLAGCTVSAVCSVTDAPPTLIVCINSSSANSVTIRRNGVLCVNVLSADQQQAAERFATSGVCQSRSGWLRLPGARSLPAHPLSVARFARSTAQSFPFRRSARMPSTTVRSKRFG